MLALPALPWSPQYKDEEMKPNLHYVKSEEQKRMEFEETKEELRRLAREMGK